MARPVRVEFGGDLYHPRARGDRREAIYADALDREHFLELLGQMTGRFNWCCHAYCPFGVHFTTVGRIVRQAVWMSVSVCEDA